MRAWSLIRTEPHYRHGAFRAGLSAAGYDVCSGSPLGILRGDVLCVWNRYGHIEQIADRFEAEGGTVLVAENGYVKGRHDGGDYYALAIHGHNGSGRWHVGGTERWNALGVELKPWRTEGKNILVAPNRTFGMRGTVMPANWAEDVAQRLRKMTRREVRIRHHPGNNAPAVPLERDLRDAWAVVIWASSVGVKALIDGIPVICEAPYWICKGAAAQTWDAMHEAHDWTAARLAALQRLAWAQWTVQEIGTGEPFRHLLRATRQAEIAASA